MAKKKKYYVVWVGVNPGVYDSWEECKLQIKGYPNASYKSFKNKEEAEAAFSGIHHSAELVTSAKNKNRLHDYPDIVLSSLSVDAACSTNPGKMEYRGVDTATGKEIFHQGPFEEGTNNIGEFLALVHALAILKEEECDKKVIYTDSITAMAWVRNKKVKTTLQKTKKNARLFSLIDRALLWLSQNNYNNPILKWDTKNWGEIPADFGRK